MRLTTDNPKADQVVQVLVDGKPVVGAVAADTDEGWVVVKVPKLPESQVTLEKNASTKDTKEVPEFEWEEVTLKGNVQVTFADGTVVG